MKGLERKLEQYSSLTVEQENRTMNKLNKDQAEKISQLINSLTIWAMATERAENNEQQLQQYMTWHDEVAEKLAEFGINVATYKIKDLA